MVDGKGIEKEKENLLGSFLALVPAYIFGITVVGTVPHGHQLPSARDTVRSDYPSTSAFFFFFQRIFS